MSLQDSSSSGRAARPRVLLLHPEDRYSPVEYAGPWDLIVDFGHAGPGTHQDWSRRAGCPVLGIFDFCQGARDLYRARELIQFGIGRLVDRFGIDWWDVLSVMITPGILHLLMVHRLAPEIAPRSDLFMTRPLPGGRALARTLGLPLHDLQGSFRAMRRRAQHYFEVVSTFDPALTRQIFLEKFDGRHAMRSRFARRRPPSGRPVVVLPSAYVNVTRSEVSFAAALPEDQFLLVYARAIAKLKAVPRNVQTLSLDPYFEPSDKSELASLLNCWSLLKNRMVSALGEFVAADAAGLLGQVTALLPWGISIRDAWANLFDAENVAACFSADDSNPYTRLPLILAKQRKIPTLACHHGALDYMMAVKTNYADFYLAKSEMERDYLLNVCHVAPEVIQSHPASSAPAPPQPAASASEKPWLVFFTEFYTTPWRADEIYRDLMPSLASLAQSCGLKLVFKLHPFDNRKSYQGWIARYLPGESGRQTGLMTGPPSADLWSKIRFAITVQSTTALECYHRGIPVFLCGWLRDPYCGYLEQFARFGVGQVLHTPEQIAEIPRRLEKWGFQAPLEASQEEKMDVANLRDLFQPRAVTKA